ncbi:DMT family transporter [Hathewaya histolytica]|uniref:Transporter n=1 Tax=Hathewaya histolytica TaxID=1498 RepID=A0A4U9RSE3_HATHI|nr:DMT family transporter [Hathewaya histolytica]VTQ94551.1 transporter [Hathewaya histolytica]
MEKVDNKKSLIADLSLLLCAIIWGVGFVATDTALKEGIKPFYTMAIRFSIAFVFLCILFFKKLKKVSKKDLKAGAVVGSILFLAFSLQTIGLQFTTPGKQSFLTGIYVVIVPFLYWIVTKKAPDKYTFLSTVLCLLGTSLLTLDGGFSIAKGDTLTLICAIFFAAQIVFIEYYIKETDPVILTILQMGMAAILSLICALVTKEQVPLDISTKGWLAVFYLGSVSTMIAYIIQNVAQKYTSSTHAAIILCLETVFGSVFSAILLKEKFTPKMILGCIIIFIALVTSETKLKFLRRSNLKKDLSE